MTLAGKRVLVTGGGSGCGADLARGFAAAGAQVVISGRREDALRAVAEPLGAGWVQADVTDETSVKRMYEEAGPCDIVIANAGAADSAPFGRTTLDQWSAMLAVNLTGVFLTFREGLAQLARLGPADRGGLDRGAEGLCQGGALCRRQARRGRNGAQSCP
jgi:3-hydroxybutyrate dehydrogenase